MRELDEKAKEREDAALPQADLDFEKAARGLNFPGVEAALRAGADPNRVMTSTWSDSEGCRVIYLMGEERDRRYLDADGKVGEAGRAHASAMRALVEAGADFSLPCLMERAGRGRPFSQKSRSSFSGRGSNLWASDALPIESCVWFAKGGGDMGSVFGHEGRGHQVCSAIHSRSKRHGSAEEVLEPMWEVAIKPIMEAGGGKMALLTEALGSGLLEWSQWLIAKGAKPAPRADGSGALHMLANETMFYASPARAGHCGWTTDKEASRAAKAKMVLEAVECAKLAVELGEDPQGGVGERVAPLLSLLAQEGKTDVATSLSLARALVELGAEDVGRRAENPFMAYALGDPANALVQLDFALAMGADPKDRPQRALFILLKRATPEDDKQAAKVIARLAKLGADLSQTKDCPKAESLVAMAARSGLWESMKALAAAGCDMSWSDPSNGDTAMSLAAWWSVERGRSGCAEGIARWLGEQGAPIDEVGNEGVTALQRAAKALDDKLCAALLEAGADANRPMGAKALTPGHLACARFEKKKEKAQLKTLEVLARHGADFAKLDGGGRSAMEIASKKGFLSVVMSVANKANGVALEGDSGARAAKVLGERGSGFLSVVEASELAVATAGPPGEPKPKRARRAL